MNTIFHVTKRLEALEQMRRFLSDERKAGRDVAPITLDNGETVYFRFEQTDS